VWECRCALLAVIGIAVGCASRVPDAGRPPPAAPRSVPARSSAPARAASRAAPISGVGSSHPFFPLAAAPDGTWVALCQARSDTNADGRVQLRAGAHGELSGDRAQGFIVLGAGAGTPIDELLAFSPDGRYLAVRRAVGLWLLDSSTRSELPLSAGQVDLESDLAPFRGHRAVAFDPSSKRLLYVRRGPAKSEIVVRDLASGREQSSDPGAGEIWRAEFVSDGPWLLLHMVADDTNGNGKLEWPAPRALTNDSQCASTLARFPVWQPRGDVARTRLAHSERAYVEDVAGFVTALGDGFVIRQPSERLVWKAASPEASPPRRDVELAPAKCAARVVFVDSVRGALVIGCSGAGLRWPLRLVLPGYSADLDVDLAPTEFLRPCEARPRLLALYPGQGSLLLDLERRVLLPLRNGDLVLCTQGKTALLQRARELWTFDADSGEYSFVTGELSAQRSPRVRHPLGGRCARRCVARSRPACRTADRARSRWPRPACKAGRRE